MKRRFDHQRRLAVGGRPDRIVRFSGCQWLAGDAPFSDADKCGAPVAAPGCAYCEAHRRQAVARPQTAGAEAGDDGS